jgi:hypothetical protein
MVAAIPLLMGVLFWLGLSTLGLHHTRWGMPMFITPLLVSAIGIHTIIDFAKNRVTKFKTPAVVATVIVSVFATANMIASSVVTAADFLRLDTRAIATEDFERRGITADNSVYEGYTVHYPNGPWRVFNDFDVENGQLIPLENTFDYVVISSSMYGRYMAEARYVDEQRFYEILESTYPLVVEYGGRGHGGSITNPVTNIPLSLSHLLKIAAGESPKGPTIKVFAVPDEVRRVN